MPEIQDERFRLRMNDDGTGVALEDLARRQAWRLDESTRLAACGQRTAGDFADGSQAIKEGTVRLLGVGKAQRLGIHRIEVQYRLGAGELRLSWVLEPDGLHVLAEGRGDLTWLALPGTFTPDPAGNFTAAIANAQGILHTGKGLPFRRVLASGGHANGYSMAMFGQLADRAALLVVAETDDDALCHWEKTAAGQIRLMWLQRPCYDKLAYPREVVIIPTAPDVTSLCKTYRRYEAARGRIVTWEQKLARRSVLEQLFGATIVFVGYHQDDQLDYVDSFRRLKAAGIDRAFVYPAYLSSSIDISAMGVAPIDIRRHLPLLKELGYAAGSFIYITDGSADAGPEGLLAGPDGEPVLSWQIDQLKWFVHSASRRKEWARRLLSQEHAGLDGIHYDVLCSCEPREDWSPLHRDDRRADRQRRIEVLLLAAERNMIVSSEGFQGRLTPHYDLGSTKYAHMLGGEEYCLAPMTMLVYHDCAIHMWWEVDNYNNFEHRTQFGRGQTGRLNWGGGALRQQAAIDALLGCPPDIFPFGLQYNYVPHSHPKIYTYRFRLEDPLVAEAIELAKPVAQLHRRIGKLEMVEHRMHRPDGALQETVFADGTRVIANFANVALEAPGGPLAPETWIVR